MENTQLQGVPTAPDGDEMMIDSEVVELINQLKLARQAAERGAPSSDGPLAEVEQAEVLGQLIHVKQARKRAAQSQFDEQAMAEAARAIKRPRTNLNADFRGAQKCYAYGPVSVPFPTDPREITAMKDMALDTEVIGACFVFVGEHTREAHILKHGNDTSKPDLVPTYKPGFNLLESVCSSIWLAVEVAKHLRPSDIVNLYSTSKTFHDLLDQHWQSSIVAWAEHMAPSSFRIFYWKFFGCYTRTDPTGTTWEAPGLFADAIPHPPWAERRPVTDADKEVRSVPGLRYLAMLVKREVRVRDILAKLARQGHRLPSRCHEAVKKMWLLMDLPTNTLRRAFIRSTELWATEDIYNAQMFVTKLQMRFNEPVFGPDAPQAVETILGSPEGLNPLWQLLRGKKYTSMLEAMQMRLRYLADDQAIQQFRSWEKHYGLPSWALGRGHLEGWGRGNVHLSRPDELLIEEAARRGLNLKDHLTHMSFWGHVDWQKRANLVPTEEELYMSDDDLPAMPRGSSFLKVNRHDPYGYMKDCGNVPFEYGEWKPEHALLARWDKLTRDEKRVIREHIGRTETKMSALEDDDEGFWDLTADELRRLNLGKESITSVDAQDTYDREGEPEPDVKAEPAELHDGDCLCEDCQPDFDNYSHDGSCVCQDCQDETDFWAEREDVDGAGEDGSDMDDDDDDANGQQNNPVIAPTLLMPQVILQNPNLRSAWSSLAPAGRQAVAGILAAQRDVERTAVTASAAAAAVSAPRQFPNITDPASLALLHKLDGIEEVPAGGDESDASSDASGGDDGGGSDEEMIDEGYNSNGGDDGADQPGAGGDDASSESSMDDDQLKALADLDYSEDELDFDMGSFQALLKRGRDDGSYHYRAGGDGDDDDEEEEDAFGAAHEADLRSPGLAAEMRLPDTINY